MDVDHDALAYAMIKANTEANMCLERPGLPKEKNISLETVMENRRKIDEICARLKARAANWTDGPRGE